MLMFNNKVKLMRSKEGKEITKKYNKLAEVLVTYEMVHYRNWIKQVGVCVCVCVCVLIRDYNAF
ncbi:unnamed protein product [Trichobilharzia regenti]|nr:unnamed protein product [Trichobilharzia regenti]